MKIYELVEGWGAEKQARDLEKSNARWRPVVAKYADDPVMSDYLKYFRIYGGNSPEEAEEKALHAVKKKLKLPDFWTNPKPVHGYKLSETASAGATSAGNIATVDAPQLSPGKARGKKSYTGSVATGSGTKAPPQPKVKQPKTSAGTAVNALDMKGANLFGGGSIKR